MPHVHKFSGHGGENHLPRFIESVRSNSPEAVACSIADGNLSSAMCHLGNISHRLGEQTSPADITDAFSSSAFGGETWRRLIEHLVINEVDLNKNTLGPVLTFDGSNERFTGTMAEKELSSLR